MRTGAVALLLAAPMILAFHSGGFFAEATLWAGLAAWVATAAVLLLVPAPLPSGRAARVCLASLAGLAAWTAVSIAWSPLKDQALRDAEHVWLYLALLLTGIALLRTRRLLAMVEPGLALGAAIAGAYALAARLLSGIVDPDPTAAAGARLDQPLTYWNAVGLLMAFGVVLCVRIAADEGRRAAMRIAASAAAPALALALYLTLSRGALAALALGAVVLVVATRRRAQADAVAVATVCGATLVAVASRFDAVDSLTGDAGDLERQGLIVLGLTILACAVAGLTTAGLMRLEAAGSTWTARLPRRRAPVIAAAVGFAVALGVVAFGPRDDATPREATPAPAGVPTDPSRLRSLESDRYEYWDVAVAGLSEEPLRGLGSGGFGVLWLAERDIEVRAKDAHSLYLETALELGVPGLLLLFGFLGAAGVLTVRQAARYPGLAAVVAMWVMHASWDWDWEMPAVTAPFVIAVAALAAADEEGS